MTDLLDKLPPQSLELEEAVLGGILLDPDAIGRVRDILFPEAFYLTAHKDIYAACRRLHEQNSPTDLLFVTRYLQDVDLLQRIGGKNKLAQLVDRTISAVNVDQYAKTLVAKYQKRLLIKACQEIIDAAYSRDFEMNESLEVANLLNLAQERIQAVESINIQKQEGLRHIGEICPEVYTEIQEVAEGNRVFTKTGFFDLDGLLDGGLKEDDLAIVMARPSMGKSSFMINTALNIIAEQKHTVAMFSLEMSNKSLTRQALAIQGNIYRSQIQQAKFDQVGWEKLLSEMQILSKKYLYMDEDSHIDITKLIFRVRNLIRELEQRQLPKLSLIMIDYLQLMVDRNKNQLEAIGIVTNGLKKLAKEVRIPIVCLSQLSRSVESRDNKRPIMSDVRASGYVEEDADVIISLYRDEYYNPDSPDRGLAEIAVLKNRGGPTGTVKLLFDPMYGVFKNLARPKYMD